MVNISFEIGGKKVDPRNMGNILEKIILEKVKESIINRVGNIRCPIHGSSPSIVCTGRDYQNLSFKISGCCESVINEVKTKLQ
jgi:hypothetical protein